jgi:excisionase family DNA binding protein
VIDDRAVLTVPEAARLLRVSPRTYYQAASRGEVPATRIGRRLVVSGAGLRRFLEVGEGVTPMAHDGTAKDEAPERIAASRA